MNSPRHTSWDPLHAAFRPSYRKGSRAAAVLLALLLGGCVEAPPSDPAGLTSEEPALRAVLLDGEGYVDLPEGTAWAATHFRVPPSAFGKDGDRSTFDAKITSQQAVAEAAASFLFLVGDGGQLILLSSVPKLTEWRFMIWTSGTPEEEEFVILFVAEGLEAPARLRITPSTSSAEGGEHPARDLVVAHGDRASLSIYREHTMDGAASTVAYGVDVSDTRHPTALPTATLRGPGDLRVSASRASDPTGFHVAFFATGGMGLRAGMGQYERSLDGEAETQSRVLLPLNGNLLGSWSGTGRNVEERLELRMESPEVDPRVTLISTTTTWDPAAHGLSPDQELELWGGVEPPVRGPRGAHYEVVPLPGAGEQPGG